jgi:phosphate transport system substrate-binding protein
MENTPKYVFMGFLVLVVGALVALGLHGRRSAPPEATLRGAGSTFVYPLMVQWSANYQKAEGGCKLAYRSVGSGAGIRDAIANKVDFACSDAPLTDEELAQAREADGELVHVPLVLGAVVPAYHLDGLKAPLRFTGELLADVYLGKVTRWDDESLRALNPGVELPPKPIHVVHRSDGSGTTWIWVDYLSRVSPEWKRKVGVGTEVRWPTGEAAKGNEGVAEKVHKTPGAIGYVELTYAYRLDLAYGQVRNREGEFVKAGLPSITTAADNALSRIPDDLRYSLANARGKGSYPVCGTTWALVRVPQPAAKRAQVVDFLRWATGPGQDSAVDLLYARLPPALVERAQRVIDRIEAGP